MKIRVFGKFRDLIGSSEAIIKKPESPLQDILREIQLTDGSTLYDHLSNGSNIKEPYRVFINGRRVNNKDGMLLRVKDGDEVVITPPISAGSGMVDISDKDIVYREAEARGGIILSESTINLVKKGLVEKGDVFEAAKIAAYQAVKMTPSILAYCHPIHITNVSFRYEYKGNEIIVSVKVKAFDRTGVEMEALTGVSAALLTIWDMVKKYEKDEYGNYPNTYIKEIHVVYKKKGDEVK